MHPPLRLLGLTLICLLTAGLPAPLSAQQQGPGAGQGGTTGGGLDSARVRTGDIAHSNGRPEFIVIGPPRQVATAAQALAAQGAQILRQRELPALRQRAIIVDLRRQLSLNDLNALVARVAPQARADRHVIYRYAASPRVYAPAMLGVSPGSTCALRRRVAIGVIDGPVDPGHPALRPARVTTHSVLLKGDGGTGASHGTAVAGLMVGQDAAGALTGFAPGAQLFAVTAFAREKGGPGADVERIAVALDWLLGRNVRLINMSFAGPPNTALDAALVAGAKRGAVMIAASGNDGGNIAAWPAASPNVIAVTAIDAARRRYSAANYGSHIEFAAPGVDLFVARTSSGGYASGTSYAAPIVTALAAQLMARGAGSLSSVRAGLRKSASDLGDAGRDVRFGWGLPHLSGC